MDQHPSVFDRLCTLLSAAAARYRVIEHPAAGRSEEVAAIRGTDPGQGAKAMLCTVRSQPQRLVLTVLPGTSKLDFRKVGAALGLGKATLVDAERATQLTGCVVGAIPPFVFDGQIELLVEPALVERWSEIAFNAGRLDRSIVLDTADYLRVAQPRLVAIAQDA
jgi:Ala-tRNA(Pro) deacylase